MDKLLQDYYSVSKHLKALICPFLTVVNFAFYSLFVHYCIVFSIIHHTALGGQWFDLFQAYALSGSTDVSCKTLERRENLKGG